MFNFYLLAQYLQQGEYNNILEILERPIRERQQIVLTPEDIRHLLEILVTLNEVPLLLPENKGYQIINYHPYPKLSRDYVLFPAILNTINKLICINDNLVFSRGSVQVSPRLLDFLLSEENQDRGFLINVIFQNFITDITRDSRTPFLQD